MRKRRLLLIILISLFIYIPFVEAVDLDIEGDGASGLVSSPCDTGAKCVTLYMDTTTAACYGFRVSLYRKINNVYEQVNESGAKAVSGSNADSYNYTQLHTINFWNSAACATAADRYSNNDDYSNVYNSNVGLQHNKDGSVAIVGQLQQYLKIKSGGTAITPDNVYNMITQMELNNYYLGVIYESSQEYYLQVQPVYGLVAYIGPSTIKHRFFGTSGNLLNLLASTDNANNDNTDFYSFSTGNNSNWNTIRNFICSMYIANGDKCTDADVTNVNLYELYKTGTNGLGKAFIKISDYIRTGELQIKKTNLKGDNITGKTTKFQLYKDSTCYSSPYGSEISFSNGLSSKVILPYGTYYLKETQAPDGYRITNESSNCRLININSSSLVTVTVVNKTPCEDDFDNSNKSPEERIRLYKTYNRMNNLLNFTETRTAYACSSTPCSRENESACLYASTMQNTFGPSNLSCYDQTIDVGSVTLFCGENFTLTNKLTNFNKNSVYNFGTTFSGQMVVKFDESLIATATLNQNCYSYSSVNNNSVISNRTYKSYIKGINFGNNTNSSHNQLIADSNPTFDFDYATGMYSGYTYYKFSDSLTVNYNLSSVFSHINNGDKIYKDYLTNTLPNYRFLGYGLVSNLNESDGNYYINFGVEFSDEADSMKNIYNNKIEDNNSCQYTIRNEIINPPGNPTDPEKLNLEFRVIDANTTDPKKIFPGISGLGRKVGSNWCIDSTINCDSSDRDLINNINMEPITGGVSSYGRTVDGISRDAIYVINLDSTKIRAIREYNENHSYDEYDLEYNEDTDKYESTFLDEFGF